MKRILITIFLSIILFFVKAQNINAFYKQINIATNYAKTGKADSAITIFEDAFSKVDYVNIAYLKRAMKLSKALKDKKRVIKYKKQKNGANDDLGKIIDSLVRFDINLRNKKIYRKQKFLRRCIADSSCDKSSKKFLKCYSLQKKIDETNLSNVICLLNLFDKFGFIGEELVGKKRSRTLAVIVMLIHFDADTNNRILDSVLLKALYNGRLTPYYYSTIIDRHLFYVETDEVSKFEVQKYWTWPYSINEKLNFDKEKVLKLREGIGMYGSDVWQEKIGNNWVLKNKYNYN